MYFREETREKIITLTVGLFAIIIASFGVSVVDNLGNLIFGNGDSNTKIENIEKDIEIIKANISPYGAKDNMTRIEIITNFKNSSLDGEPSAVSTKNILTNGKFSKGYIYIKASVDGNSLTIYDGVYIKLNGKVEGIYQELGGHIIKNKSLVVPQSESYTELLYDLSDVKYKKNYDDPDVEVISGDWLNLLNNGSSRNILGFSSTLREGVLEEVSIYYECTPDTDCNIEIVSE